MSGWLYKTETFTWVLICSYIYVLWNAYRFADGFN